METPRIPTTSPIEDFSHGIIRYTIEDGKIIVIQSEGYMAHAAVDAWAAAIHKTFTTPAQPHIFALYDMSHPRQGVTPYGMKKGEETYTYLSPDHKAYVAIIFPNTILFRMAANFLQMIGRKRKNVEARLFTHHDLALTWLRTHLREVENNGI